MPTTNTLQTQCEDPRYVLKNLQFALAHLCAIREAIEEFGILETSEEQNDWNRIMKKHERKIPKKIDSELYEYLRRGITQIRQRQNPKDALDKIEKCIIRTEAAIENLEY